MDRSDPKNARVVAVAPIPQHTRVATYPGWVYPVKKFTQLLNAGRRGTKYAVTMFKVTQAGRLNYDWVVDPTSGVDVVAPEFHNCVGPYVNEPSPGQEANLRWVYDFATNTVQYWTRKPVRANEELLICYGKEYSREYDIACGNDIDMYYVLPGMQVPAVHTDEINARLAPARAPYARQLALEDAARTRLASALLRAVEKYKKGRYGPMNLGTHHAFIESMMPRFTLLDQVPVEKEFWQQLGTLMVFAQAYDEEKFETIKEFFLYLPSHGNYTSAQFVDFVRRVTAEKTGLPWERCAQADVAVADLNKNTLNSLQEANTPANRLDIRHNVDVMIVL